MGAGGVLTTDLDHVRPAVQQSVSSWSCIVGLRDLVMSLPASLLCDSAVLGLYAFIPTNPSKTLSSPFCPILSPCLYSFFLFIFGETKDEQ